MPARDEIDNDSSFEAIGHQVQCDVNFLENRLKMMRAQHNPNQPVIKTYEEMLSSRLNVLQRLKQENEIKRHAS